jgi:hypothetical protein
MGGEVKGMRALLVASSVVLLVAACGNVEHGPFVAKGQYKVYEATPQQVAVIDSRSHAAERKLPLGTATTDWKHFYSVVSSSLVDTDPETGATLHTMRLPGSYYLPSASEGASVPGGLSQNGQWLVLVLYDGSPNSLPSASHLLVVDTSFGSAATHIDLKGDFQFDAISNDGQRVYLLEYLSGSAYRVRFYDVGSHFLSPNVVVDKSDGSAAMAGYRLMSIPSPNGDWLYTVYARENKGAFIHALNLSAAVSACIDLPGSGYNANPDEFRWSLALSHQGTRLYAANGGLGVVAQVDIGGNQWPALGRTARLDSSASILNVLVQDAEAKGGFGGPSTVVSQDDKTLVTAGSSGLVWIDTSDLHVRQRALGEWRVASLALSPDGKVLYALNDIGLIADVSMESGAFGTKFDPGTGFGLGIMRVAAA